MQRPAIEQMLDAVDWKEVDPGPADPAGIPRATHEGVLEIGGFPLHVYQLDNGQRIVEAGDLERFFGTLSGESCDA